MKEKPDNSLISILENEPLRLRWRRIVAGVMAPAGSPERAYARFALLRMFGPGLISIVMGIGVVVFLFTFAVGEALRQEREIEVKMIQAETVKLDDVKIEEIKPEEIDVSVPVDLPAIAGPPSEYSTPSESPGVGVDGDLDTPMVAFAPVLTKSPLVLKGLYGNRTKGGRDKALKSYGGSSSTENAVLRALRWLKEHQKEDGSWAGVSVAYTGLAILCYLAHGETPSSEEFGPTVEKAIKYLLSKQGQNGSYSTDAYAHAIATYALSEAFAMTKIMTIKEAAERALQVILDGQQNEGGWYYGYAKGDIWDLSVMGWQIQALKAAHMGGIELSRMEEAMKKATKAVQLSYHNLHGSFCYQGKPGVPDSGGPMWSMNGIGALCLQYLGKANSKETRGGLKALDDLELVWGTVDSKGKAVPAGQNIVGKPENKPPGGEIYQYLVRVYAYYYINQAKFQSGGPQWKRWNEHFTRVLLLHQKPEGCWEEGDFGSSYGGAKGEPDQVYTTCFCCLMLEVYYRYLPTYQKIEQVELPALKAEEDVTVRVL